MATLKDIAQHVGISVSAVSMALRDHASISDETKRKVWQAKKDLDYKLKNRPTGNIAFVLFDRSFDSFVYARFFQAIGEMAASNEQQSLFLSLESEAFNKGKVPAILKKRGVDGIIVSGIYEEATHRNLASFGIPIVALGIYELGETPWAACEVSVEGGVRLAIRTLTELEHRRIGLLVSTPPALEYGRRIRDGYSMALSRFGLEEGGVEEEKGSETGAALAAAMGRLLERRRPPTAVIVEKAHSAVYDACEARGLRIPEDISIIALGRSEERMRPPLVTVESRPHELARAAYEKLQRMIEVPDLPLTREIFSMYMGEGGSIGPAPKGD